MAEGYQTIVHDQVGGRSADADQTCADDNVSGRKGKRCDPCRTKGRWNDAVVLCKTCKQHQCEKCSMNHSLNDIMVGHDLQSLKKEDQRKICTKHKQNVNKYCVDHDEMCCGLCVARYHKQCTEVAYIKPGVNKSLANIRTKCKYLYECNTKRMRNFQKQAKDIPDQIDIMKNEMNKLFDDFKANVVQLTRGSMQTEGCAIDKQSEIQKCITKDVDNITSTYSDNYYRMQLLSHKMKQHKGTISEQEGDRHVLDFIFEINKSLLSFIQSGEDIGSLQVEKTFTKATAGTFVRPFSLRLLASRDVKPDGDNDEEPFITGLDFLPDGRVIGVDCQNCKLLIFDDKLDLLGTEKTERLYDVVYLKDDTIVCIGGGEIVFFEISRANTVKTLQTKTYSRNMFTISIISDERFCASTYDDRYPACIVSASEAKEFEPKLPEKNFKVGEFEYATTFIPDRQIVVLSDKLNKSISFHDVSGSICVTTVVKDDRIQNPNGLCVGPGDCVFVCCVGTNSIVQLSPTGRVIGSCKVDMIYPWAVAVSKDSQKLVVSSASPGKRELQLFQLR